jgi:hypothetical protein
LKIIVLAYTDSMIDKTVTTLTATPPADVAIQDLATVDLDVGALAHGYQASQGLGHAVSVKVTARARWGGLAWRP